MKNQTKCKHENLDEDAFIYEGEPFGYNAVTCKDCGIHGFAYFDVVPTGIEFEKPTNLI